MEEPLKMSDEPEIEETAETRHESEVQEAVETSDASQLQAPTDQTLSESIAESEPPRPEVPAGSGVQQTLDAESSTDPTDAEVAQDPWQRTDDVEGAREIPTAMGLLKFPLLAIVAVASLLLAGWNYSALVEARGQLASLSDAKASVERSLAEAQGRLSAAEKAVADVKAALTTAPSASSTITTPEAAAKPGKEVPQP